MFSKGTDLIKRIMNLILVVWIIVAVVILYNSVVNLLFDNYQYTYEEYQRRYCNKGLLENDNCEKDYERHKSTQKDEKRGQLKILVNSSGNILIIGTFMFLLNRDKK
ncbi:MAG: hypothetical protein PHW32_04820 [Bacilli bacterium]|nr:hypothetical protein [Bacilli bacterium]MDD4283044.1 hypothetical protein [Bacilli bacterium]MDD4718564.1 hypothetical protein [Bacilli bacterium]